MSKKDVVLSVVFGVALMSLIAAVASAADAFTLFLPIIIRKPDSLVSQL